MIKRLPILLLIVLLISACADLVKPVETNRLQVTVSVAPQAWLVERIAGDLVTVQTMVGSGDDPHTYEPTPAQMVALSDTDIYFTIGIEFEAAWMPKLTNSNRAMRVVASDWGVEKISAGINDGGLTNDDPEEMDPHIWYSPKRMRVVAQTIAKELVHFNVQNKDTYLKNLETVLSEIEAIEGEVSTTLSGMPHRHFLIIHPTLGYLAADFGLVQMAVESEGQEPGPEDLANLITQALAYEVTAVFYQKGDNVNSAQAIARQLGSERVFEIESMPADWPAGMLHAANQLKEALQ